MSERSISFKDSIDRDAGLIKTGFEKAFVIGSVVAASLIIGNANTKLGLNPLNYAMAAGMYTV